MHHFRKKSSAKPASSQPPESTPIEHTKRARTTHRHGAKDPERTRATSSNVVPSSIASLSRDPVGVVSYEPGTSKESRWRTVYGAARTAVEITKESSDMFLPLKAVVGALSVLIKNYDQTAANAEQIKDIEQRVKSLSEVLGSPVGDQDRQERARREALRTKLIEIIAKLRPLSEQHGLLKFLNNADHANALSGFVQDLANAVTDYQTSIQQSIYENTRNIIEATDLELLEKLNPVRDAGYQAGHHDTCLRGTRRSVLDEIMQWAKDPQERHVFWLNGLAGTGKSTIAQTFSGMVAHVGTLGASFFCSRDYLDRKELKNIFPTLAYQLACRYPAFRAQVVQVIKQDPSIAQSALISQLKSLIVDPLSSSRISCVIVVDALDECVDDQPSSAILSVLGRYVKRLPLIKFFLTGRPEPRIRTGFRLPLLEPLTQIFLLHKVKLSTVDKDIRLYLQERLGAVAKRRSDLDLSNPWPRDEDLTILTKKSSGLFIFASTLIKFIESEHHEPDERLQLIVSQSDSTIHEGQEGIDLLYTQILIRAFSNVKGTEVFANLRRVLGAVILSFNPLSRTQIAGILGISTSLITTTLRHLHSVLLVPKEDFKKIRIFHKSFPDFLQDRNRCPDPKFFIDLDFHHEDIASCCLELLWKLRPNPCGLPDFVMNRDVVNLPELLEDKVGSAMRYACRYWIVHVESSPPSAVYLVGSILRFFKVNAIPWIEVMALENQLEDVIHRIYGLLDWLGIKQVDHPRSRLHNLVQDCLRFTMHFFHPIQQSAPHIYHSALPLSPGSSILHSFGKTLIRGCYGFPHSWGAVIRTITPSSGDFTYMTTFGNRIAAYDDVTVGIYDTVTGVLKLSLSPPGPVQAISGSPDGSMLFCTHRKPSITAWDLQTGGLIHTLVFEGNPEDTAISLQGHYLACGLSNGSVKTWELASMEEGGAVGSDAPVACLCWLQPEEQLVVAKGRSMELWDIIAGEFLYLFKTEEPIRNVVYARGLDRLAVTTSKPSSDITVLAIDSQPGDEGAITTAHYRRPKFGGIRIATDFQRLRFFAPVMPPQPSSCFAFSQDTMDFVCGGETSGLGLLGVSSGYRETFNDNPGRITSASVLPHGIVVANVAGSGIQLLDMDKQCTPSHRSTDSTLTVHTLDHGNIIATLPAGRDHIVLLETAAMSELHKIPVWDSRGIPTKRSAVLCASLKNGVAVYCFGEGRRRFLQLWKFRHDKPEWTVEIYQEPLVGGVSPSGARLVTFLNDGRCVRIFLRDTLTGELQAESSDGSLWSPHPLGVKFESEDRFSSQHDTHRIPYVISSSSKSGTSFSHSIIRHKQVPSVERHYGVDKTREWIVYSSKKVCWIPPGYIGPMESSCCWAGHSLVMIGKDNVLRKLTLESDFERWGLHAEERVS